MYASVALRSTTATSTLVDFEASLLEKLGLGKYWKIQNK